ncbi:organic solute transporter Ostalpha-domain-containing protein [Favolaschia claudopus]|uniref:Organic solute transporter Ostalpha-domain-containing protein n=1 Tax=Favolaschia claudopus TaxID=2862362 RepID=A0AAW0DWN5_9AGAR
MSNSTACPVKTAETPPSLFQNGNLVFQAHHVGWIIAGFFTVVATITSLWLVNKHLMWYTNKKEQRYIVRLLFMVPLYAIISLASYLWWSHSTPLLLIRDGYESTVLTAFFYLLLTYLSPNPDDQKAIFHKVGLSRAADAEAIANGKEPRKWMFPLGFIKAKPADGLYFLQLMKYGVLQYCVIRPTTTLAAVVLNYIGWYCEGSFSPRFAYIYILAIVSISVSIAMYCLIQLYIPVSAYLAPQKPLMKLFAIKAVVFLTFWQATLLSCLTLFGVVKDTEYMTAEDINIGIAALAETFEMMLFGFLHLSAFSYKPYKPFHDPKSKAPPPTPTPRLRALGHAFDFRETFREIRAGWGYMIDRMRGREPAPDYGARRIAHYETVFDRPRQPNLPTNKDSKDDDEKELLAPSRVVMETPPWLEIPGRDRREKSEALEVQIEKELERRGYGSHIPGRGHIGPPHDLEGLPGHKPQRSWWKNIYSRVSQSGHDIEEEPRLTPHPSKQRKSKSRSKSRHPRSKDFGAERSLLFEHDNYDFDDPPPQPILTSSRRREDRHRSPPLEDQLDTLAPLSGFRGNRSSQQTRPSNQRGSGHPNSSLQPAMSVPPPRPGTNPMQSISQPQFARSDSLLGRVFPPTASNPSSVDQHGSDSGRSMPSTSAHGASPYRMTPRGRLILTTPKILGKQPEQGPSPTRYTPALSHSPPFRSEEAVHLIRSGPTFPQGEWVPRGSHTRDSALPNAPEQARTDEVVHSIATGSPAPGEWAPRGSHIRESALPQHQLVTSPSSDFAGNSFDPPVPRLPDLTQKSNRHSKPQSPTSGLRRQSAQIYSPDSPSRRGRRQSVDVIPQVPQTSYTPLSRVEDRYAARRQSAPLGTTPSSPLYHEQDLRRVGYQVENMSSDITQPALSGTLFGEKHPIITYPSRQDPPGLPQLPHIPTSTQPFYDPYLPVAGSSSRSKHPPPRSQDRRRGEQRPGPYYTTTTNIP